MPDRKYPRSGRRAIVSYAGVVASSGEYVVGCFSKAVLEIARILVSTRALWPTTYATAYFDNGYDIPSAAQLAVVEELISEFLEDTNDMDCTDFASALSAISDAINAQSAASGCGCGSGDAGSDDEAESTEEVGDIGDPGGDFPDGFGSRAEYETYKCNVADWLITSLRADVVWWAAAAFGAMSLTVFGALMITPIPGARLVALLAAVVGMTGIGGGIMTSFLSVIDDNWDDLICALWEATDASVAKADLIQVFEDGVDTETANTLWRYAIKSAFALMLSNHNINKLFVLDSFTEFGTGDCTGCGLAQWWDGHLGNVIAWGSDWVDLQTVNMSPGYWAGIYYEDPSCTDRTWDITVITGTYAGTSLNNDTVLEECAGGVDANASTGGDKGNWDYGWANLNVGPHVGVALQVRSANIITLRYQFS